MEQKKERRNERIQPNRPCLRLQDSNNGQKNNPESSRPRLRRSDGDDDPQDAMTTRIARPSWTAPASAVATAMTTLGTPFRNLAGCVMGVRPEAKRYPQHQEPSLADGLSFALRRSPCSKPCSTAPCDDYRRFGAHVAR